MQRYLWEVKDKVAALVPWCQERTLDNMRKSNSLELQIGSKTDERNLERRRLLRDVILSA
jgi:antitoxin (DNA-binding transcriptional repressor) of toxin-antitoxin stability system